MIRGACAIALLLALAPAGAAPGAGATTGGGEVVRVEHRDPTTAPTRGPANALVTIEYFFIPQINAEARLPQYRMLERLAAKHPSRIRVIYRVVKRAAQIQLPVAALEAHAQGKFFELMEALHERRPNASLTKEQVLELARDAGLDGPRLAAAISDGRYADAFLANDRRLERLHGSPQSVMMNSRVVRATTEAEYERAYQQAYERALELVDQGFEPHELPRVFDEQTRRAEPPFVISSGMTEEELEADPTEHRLATPPLPLAGLPTFGPPSASGTVVAVLCSPKDSGCAGLLNVVRRQIQDVYADEVRAVWAPWFDLTAVTPEQAAELALLADAALCAEQVGSSPEDLLASPGWRWITRQLDHASRASGRRMSADKLIDTVGRELDIDSRRMSACRARMANTSLAWIERARRSGVAHGAVVIGGRIYEGLVDGSTIARLIEAELAPGVLGETVDSPFERLLFFLATPRPR